MPCEAAWGHACMQAGPTVPTHACTLTASICARFRSAGASLEPLARAAARVRATPSARPAASSTAVFTCAAAAGGTNYSAWTEPHRQA